MRTRIAVAVSLAALVASSLFAANLGKYGDWPNSPQGYFMTKADRAEWSKVNSEADAEQFVNKFVASRGPNFAADVEAATKAADDHLTVGKTAGSKTLRGKIVIVLGPPSSFAITQRKDKGLHSAPPSAAQHAMGGGGQGGGGNVGITPADIADAMTNSEMSVKFVNDYAFTYTKDKLPGNQSKDLVITVEVNPATGEDRIVDARMARQVNDLLDAAAEARAAAPAAK